MAWLGFCLKPCFTPCLKSWCERLQKTTSTQKPLSRCVLPTALFFALLPFALPFAHAPPHTPTLNPKPRAGGIGAYREPGGGSPALDSLKVLLECKSIVAVCVRAAFVINAHKGRFWPQKPPSHTRHGFAGNLLSVQHFFLLQFGTPTAIRKCSSKVYARFARLFVYKSVIVR